MPAKYFICPDGGQIPTAECIEKCRMPDRCMHISLLAQVKKSVEARPWTGTPSVTQLLKGTRQAYLEIVENYGVDPRDHIFMLLGTGVHSVIEQDNERIMSEEYEFSGVPDWYDDTSIVDFKVTSNWKVEKGDHTDWFLQVNAYRMLLHTIDGIDRKDLRIQTIIRDAKATRGQSYVAWIPVPYIPNEDVYNYFWPQIICLKGALKERICPEVCHEKERWNNNLRCKFYCPVKKFCDFGRDLK